MLTRRDFLKRMAALGLLLPSTKTIIDMGANLCRMANLFETAWGKYSYNVYNHGDVSQLFKVTYKEFYPIIYCDRNIIWEKVSLTTNSE